MSKRSAGEIASSTTGEAFNKAPGGGSKRPISADDEQGEYEDAWEDELESDEDVIDAGEDGENGKYSHITFASTNLYTTSNGSGSGS
jgi:ribosome assembly protein RRB1